MSAPHRDHDCLRIFEMLSEYLDQDLAPADCAEVRAHIADCPPCIEFLDSLEKSTKLCREFQVAEQPTPLAPQARQRLTEAFRKATSGITAATSHNRGR